MFCRNRSRFFEGYVLSDSLKTIKIEENDGLSKIMRDLFNWLQSGCSENEHEVGI